MGLPVYFLLFLIAVTSHGLGVFGSMLPTVNATFDYVIVGGGTSGLAIASRLAENPLLKVAVVEAGGSYEVEGGPLSIIPGFAAAANTGTSPMDINPLIDWNFVSLPLKAGKNRVLRYARGKTLGGTSARNYMVYHRGTQGSYDQWAEITGDSSWSWKSVLPFFKKSSYLTPPNPTKRTKNATVSYDAGAFDNTLNGPVQVTWPNHGSPFSTYVEIGLEKIGVLPCNGFNAGVLNGSSWAATTIDPAKQSRSSSATSYLRQAQKATQLKVYSHTMAKKINFQGTTATGVDVETNGVRYTLTATKEVIISAGTFQSPQILMVSGVGPKATLQAHGIPIVKDLPGVGQNLWDHLIFGVVNRVNVITASNLLHNPIAAASAMVDYTVKQTGPLTAPGFGVIGWEKLPQDVRAGFSEATREALDEFPSDWPELEYLGLDGILDGWNSALDQMTLDRSQYATVAAAMVAPRSRGSVSIASADTSTPPLIDLGYLTDPADQEVAVAAVKRLRQIWKGTNISIGNEYKPGAGVQTDEEILEFVRSTMVPVWHPSGTCAMGKRVGDPNAVVDSYAKVIGVQNLRVVDASIFPTLPPGHPQSTCYMVAEKIADAIKKGL